MAEFIRHVTSAPSSKPFVVTLPKTFSAEELLSQFIAFLEEEAKQEVKSIAHAKLARDKKFAQGRKSAFDTTADFWRHVTLRFEGE